MYKQKLDTGSAAIAYDFEPDGSGSYVKEVRLHLSAAGGAVENLTIGLDSAQGAGYDINFVTQAMNAVQDFVWIPDGGSCYIAKGDQLAIAYANSNSRDYGLEILYV